MKRDSTRPSSCAPVSTLCAPTLDSWICGAAWGFSDKSRRHTALPELTVAGELTQCDAGMLASPPGAARIGISWRSLLRAWNMRVFTVLMGQSIMAAISPHE